MENITMGNVIKEKRRTLGMTQKELAEILGVSDKAVSKWERNESLPDVCLIPQIALTLDVSIDCLFTGNICDSNGETSKTEADTEARNKTLAVSSAMLQHRINTRYTVAALMVAALVLYFFFGTTGYIALLYRPMFFCFLIAVIYIVTAMSISKHQLLLSQTELSSKKSNLGACFAATALSSLLFIMLFGYLPSYVQADKLHSLSKFIAELMGAAEFKYQLSAVYPSLAGFVLIYTAAVLTALLVSQKADTFDSTVYITSASFTVMAVLHALCYSFTGAFILKNKSFMYTFWFDNPTVIAVLQKINICCVVFAAVSFAAAAALFVFIKGKQGRIIYAVSAVPLWIYQCISSFGFINRSFNGAGSNFAQLKTGSVIASFALAAAIPHIVMILNGITKSKCSNPQNQNTHK